MEGEEIRLKNNIQDIEDQNELLEFRILELEVKNSDISNSISNCQTCLTRNSVCCSGAGAAFTCHQLPTAPFPRRPQSSSGLL